MSSKKITVIIPCFNHGDYILDAIESVGKSFSTTDIIVIDDGSDEPTKEVLKSINQENVKVITQSNQGVSKARNNGVDSCDTPYVIFLDADNLLDSNYINSALDIFESNDSIDIVYSDKYIVQEGKENVVSKLPEFDINRLLSSNFIDVCTVIKREVWVKNGGFDFNLPEQGNEDWDFWLSSYMNGFNFHHIEEPLFYYRILEDSLLSKANSKRKEIIQYLLEKYKTMYAENYSGVIVFYLELLLFKESEIDRLSNDSADLGIQVEKSLDSIWKLQTRVNELENSKVYRIVNQISVFKNKLRSNKKSASGSKFKSLIYAFSRKGRSVLRKFIALVFKYLYIWFEEEKVYIVKNSEASGFSADAMMGEYHGWLKKHLPSELDILAYNAQIDAFKQKPLFSIVIPIYNPKETHLRSAIESVFNQNYSNWELCLSDDNSSDPLVKQIIMEYQDRDPRVKSVFRPENGHISAASNSGLEIATGDYIVLMDQDDLLTVDALYHNAKVINDNPSVDLIYSDEDKVDENGVHSSPHFKPDWSPDNLLSRNYLGHLTVFKTDLFRKIGGWRIGFEGSQDYDLVLRFSEETEHIYHIPRILYHWRVHEESAAAGENAKPYAYIAATKALKEALVRRNELGTINYLDGFRGYSIRFNLVKPEAKVSIVIPTKDMTDILTTCIDSIFEKSTYKNFEVVVVDNNSEEQVFFEKMDEYSAKYKSKFKCIRQEIPFNFSTLVNEGVKNSDGEYVILLNNDTEVISEDWIEGMVEQSQRESIGVVGVKLLYPNDTIQHAGVIIGLGGAAGHVFVGENRNGPGYFNYVNMLNNYSAVTAACVMIKRDIWDKVGGFDEKYTIEYNDVDFCLRVQDMGYNNIYVPHVELYHHESISRGHPHMTKKSYERHLREIGYLKESWPEIIKHDPCYNPNLTLGKADFSIRH